MPNVGSGQPVIAPIAEADVANARRIVRLAFGKLVGAPDLDTFWTDRDYVYGRWNSPHVATFGASIDGTFVGSNFATRWGSVAAFGPLSVHPDVQEKGIAKALLAPTVDQFDAWGTTHSGLYTFPQSPLHIALYMKFGFYPRFLTAVMTLPARNAGPVPGTSRFSALTPDAKADALKAARQVTESIYPGLDLADEIATVDALGLGDTMLVDGDGGLAAFGICHWGPQSEAGKDNCLIKFGAVRANPEAAWNYGRLLDACEALAVSVGMPTLMAGTNLAREEAYRALIARGFRTLFQGVHMQRNNEPGYCRPGVYVIEDWR